MRDLMYKVTYAVDYTDTNPTVKYFDSFSEAEEWIDEEMEHRVDWIVQHSPVTIKQSDVEAFYEKEHELVTIEEIAQ